MELLQLRYFYESSLNESFAETAKKYMVPASSVSASVKRLEKELGTELFDRTSNRITLNEKGYMLAESLKEIFTILDETVSVITAPKHKPIKIRILIKERREWLAELIVRYQKEVGNVEFYIAYDDTNHKLNEFDFIIDELSDKYKELDHFLLCTELLCVKASNTSAFAGKALSFKQLKDQPFIMMQKENFIWKLLKRVAKQNGFTPNISIECNDRQNVMRYVSADMGLTIGAQRALTSYEERDIVELNVVDFNETQAVYVHHQAVNPKNHTLISFLSFLKRNSSTRIFKHPFV